MTQSLRVCGGGQGERVRPVYASRTHRLHLTLLTPSAPGGGPAGAGASAGGLKGGESEEGSSEPHFVVEYTGEIKYLNYK